MRKYFIIKIPKITYLSIAKFGVFVFVLYVCWFSQAFYESRTILYGTSLLITLFVIFDSIKARRGRISSGYYSIVPLLVIYILYSLGTGVLARDFFYLISSIVTILSFTIICFDICYISNGEKNMDWLLKIITFVALLCAFQTILFGQPFRSAGVYVTTMSSHNNPNGLALVMVAGVFSLIQRMIKGKNLIVLMVAIMIFVYVVTLTGSRKNLVACILLVGLWGGYTLFSRNTGLTQGKKIMWLCIIAIAVGFVSFYYRNYFFNSAIFARLSKLSDGSSINGRVSLYKYAINLWKDNPFFGVGYDQYRVYIGEMSHSTYAELLACSGIIGCLIWIIGMFTQFKKNFILILNKGESQFYYIFAMNILMFVIELVIGIGQVWMYDIIHLILLTYIFGAIQARE